MLSTFLRALAVLALIGSVLATAAVVAERRPAAAADGVKREKDPTHASGLTIPRFVSLRSDEVNVRTGPNIEYPIEWVFQRKAMPVEVIQEFDTWRRIRDWEGSEGWVHQSMLTGRRSVVIQGEVRALREDPREDSSIVARAAPGVVGSLRKCQGEWCEVEMKGYRGWLKRAEVWGVYPNEKVD